MEEIDSKWRNELLLLSKIAEVQPQAAYSGYKHAFKSKYNFFNRAIPTMQNHMKITENVLRNYFIPAIIGESLVPEHLRQLIALPIQLGGMAVTTPHLNTEAKYNAARLLTKDILDHIISQNTEFKPNKERISEIKKTPNDILQQPGCNNWLNIIPIEEFNSNLNKQQFLDAVRLRYQLRIPDLSTQCPCGEKFDTQHAMSCKKGGFANLHHNQLRGSTGELLEGVCHDVAIEAILQPVTDNNLVPSSANTNGGARLDVSARGFRILGQEALFDVRVFIPKASRYQSKSFEQCVVVNEQEKKRLYNRRILEVTCKRQTTYIYNTWCNGYRL